jgi:hypothetical protein
MKSSKNSEKKFKSHGFVKFPTTSKRYHDTGEGGLSVFAIWQVVRKRACCIDLTALLTGEVVDPWFNEWIGKEEDRLYEMELKANNSGIALPRVEKVPKDLKTVLGNRKYHVTYTTRLVELPKDVVAALEAQRYMFLGHAVCPVHGVLYLGSSNGAWYDTKKDHYWTATKRDLTEEGKRLLKQIDKLYGCISKLRTVLDT